MKDFQVTSAVIEVSANPHMEAGMYARLEVNGILPGCRKNVRISDSVGFMSIHVRPLFGYNGSASIHPDQWQQLIEDAPVIISSILPIPELTPEIEKWARAQVMTVITCPAVRSMKDVHPNVIKTQRWTNLVRRASSLPVTE